MRVGFPAPPSLLLVAVVAFSGSGLVRADDAPAAPTTPAATDTAPAKALDSKGAPPAATTDTPAVVVDDNKVETLLGKDVTSAKGEKLGSITDIIVSHSGEIRAAVIDFGGFLGVGSRKIAVAWPTLHFSQNGITLSMTRDELRVTPEYRSGEPIVIVGTAQSAPPTTTQSTTSTPGSPPPDTSAQPAPAK
jgi:hypothetical protein